MTRFALALLLSFSAAGAAAASCFHAAAPCASEALPVPEPSLPSAAAEARPVVISIVGVDFAEIGIGKLELAYFKKIFAFFKPGKNPDQELFNARLAAVGEDAAMNELYKRLPDDYLDARLAEVLPGGKYDIAPVRWSRDPDESDAAVPLVENEIKRVFAAARAQGRPVYLVAHSWGTVLAHTALHRLAKAAPEVRVEKLITLGSPLVPGHWWLDIFLNAQVSAGQLQQYVSKPANVGRWVNLWAKNDYFSNEIAAADSNLLEDGFAAELERRVKLAAQEDHSLRPAALRDLFFLKSLKTWHFAYIYDFQIFLRTLRENHERAIFGPVVSQELTR
jgi:hypothetical protein